MPPESQNNQPPSSTPPASPQAPQQSVPPSQPGSQSSIPARPQPLYSQQSRPPQSFQPRKKSRKKRLLIAVAALVVLLGGTAAAYFGYYLPNQPDQIWKKALDNSAKGYDKLVQYGDEQENNKGGTIKGTFRIDSNDTVIDGSIDTQYYEQNSRTKLDAGAAGTRVDLELLTNVPEGAKYPDIYARVSGLKGIDSLLGSEAGDIGASLAAFDNQWYVVDHTLFDQIEKASGGESAAESQTPSLSGEDLKAVAEAIGKANREHLFTEDPSKAAITRKQNVGKEKLDDRDVYHYKVGYNKENLKSYVNALKEELKKTKLDSYIQDQQFDEITKSIDELNGQGEADAWVDLKTKLIRKVRFTDPSRNNSYVDVALNYNGGNEYPFVVDIVGNEKNNEGKTTVGVTLNTDTNEIKLNANGEGKENGQPLKFNLSATMTPGNEKVEFNKPENAKSIIEAFGQLMGGTDAAQSLLQAPAAAPPEEPTGI